MNKVLAVFCVLFTVVGLMIDGGASDHAFIIAAVLGVGSIIVGRLPKA